MEFEKEIKKIPDNLDLLKLKHSEEDNTNGKVLNSKELTDSIKKLAEKFS